MAQNANSDFVERKEGSQVLHVRENSDSLMNSLFDSVLKKQEPSMPLTVPLSMRKLPKSFFNPPQHGSKSPSVSHSRNSSTDSTQATPAFGAAPAQGNHLRAHSSPAALQQPYAAAQQHQQHAHLKQQSYDFTDGLGPLPDGWERACTAQGLTYFINHVTQTTTWEDPRKKPSQGSLAGQPGAASSQPASAPGAPPTAPAGPAGAAPGAQEAPPPPPPPSQQQQPAAAGGQALGPLPDGWDRAETEEGEVYFINHQTRVTSWFDPRIPEQLQRPAALQLQQAASPQALQQRQQSLRLQRLQVERERLRIRQRQVMQQVSGGQ
ncbi:LOW QUALITY PROTEIN: transcriptional coactivator YAP1-A-like, partial [Pollicipes pollicipes]|uniref:LOW QUALITY PROTEIN: transcriptional coactivator YAP1-A-like n=1 Tax=Pollicipes pollicipes TaxID=41117 RepID=UPI0018855A62